MIQSITPNTKDFTWNPTVDITGGQQWFVVKVTQKDGERIYSAPIWSEEKEVDVRVSGLDVVEGVTVAGNPATLSAGISNLGTKDLTDVNVNFYYDEVSADKKIGSATIASIPGKSVKEATAVWANPLKGDHDLIAVVDTPTGDEPADNTFKLPVTVKESLGMTVMIDAAHKNENTTTDAGTYKDNLKMFTKLVQKEGYTVTENKAPLTSDLLKDVKVLVMSHPAVVVNC